MKRAFDSTNNVLQLHPRHPAPRVSVSDYRTTVPHPDQSRTARSRVACSDCARAEIPTFWLFTRTGLTQS